MNLVTESSEFSAGDIIDAGSAFQWVTLKCKKESFSQKKVVLFAKRTTLKYKKDFFFTKRTPCSEMDCYFSEKGACFFFALPR